ncbi:MAG: hypothetical protein ABSC47_13070 [Terracidiphilus sp.]|jgi:hypothetical protein
MKSNHEVKGKKTMKRTIGIIGIALLLSCGGARVFAQTDAPTPKVSETKIDKTPICYRLTYTVTEMDGTKHIGTQHFAMTVDPGAGESQIRIGSKVPIATASTSPSNPDRTEFQYVDVGLKISTRLREFSTGVEVYSKVEQSSVSEEQSSVGRNDPVIRQATLDSTALLTLGKPVMLGSLDVPGSTRHLDVEVVLELVR